MYRDVDYSLPTPEELLEEMYRAQPPGSPPSFAPPNKIPEKPGSEKLGMFKIDAGGIRPCKHRMTYLWLKNGSSFWVYLTFVGATSVSGWRWDRRRWRFFGISTNQIESFVC